MSKSNVTQMAALKIQKVQQSEVSLTIKGTSPLIVHAWSKKALNMLRLTPAERRKVAKQARDPEAEAFGSCYYMDDGETYAIPLTAIKAALIGAAHKDLGLPKTEVLKALFIRQEDSSGNIPLELDDDPTIREDIVRVGMNQTDIRYRCEFFPWSTRVKLIVDTTVLNDQDVVNLINRAGFSVGIGEWRPQKGGEFGRFEVDVNESFNVVRVAA